MKWIGGGCTCHVAGEGTITCIACDTHTTRVTRRRHTSRKRVPGSVMCSRLGSARLGSARHGSAISARPSVLGSKQDEAWAHAPPKSCIITHIPNVVAGGGVQGRTTQRNSSKGSTAITAHAADSYKPTTRSRRGMRPPTNPTPLGTRQRCVANLGAPRRLVRPVMGTCFANAGTGNVSRAPIPGWTPDWPKGPADNHTDPCASRSSSGKLPAASIWTTSRGRGNLHITYMRSTYCSTFATLLRTTAKALAKCVALG